jgi:signal transduction histidine kinase
MPPQTKLKSTTPPLEQSSAPPAEKEEKKPALVTSGKIPSELSQQLRKLAHDLSNSMETVMQASYLLAQADLDENNRKWLSLIDQASRDAARINREIREILRSNSE